MCEVSVNWLEHNLFSKSVRRSIRMRAVQTEWTTHGADVRTHLRVALCVHMLSSLVSLKVYVNRPAADC
jgi:hypothetical protein